MSVCVFFLQAEDGIRDYKVTGVQTCALPIFPRRGVVGADGPSTPAVPHAGTLTGPARPDAPATPASAACRSEERRVGKECRCGWMSSQNAIIGRWSTTEESGTTQTE